MSQKIHFSGIGGTAMVAGARLALECGWEVRGSDQVLYPPTSDMVQALGVPVYEGYAAENLDWQPDRVVLGNALSRGNAEVEAALSRGLVYCSLPEWMKEQVLRPRTPVVICGTHGKTTTTALVAHVLERCGLAPGYFIGGQPLGFEHSARLGAAGAPFVIEGDEYDTAFFDKRAKFLHYLPHIAVVTSVEFDHGDIYRDLEEIEVAFQRMLRQIPQEGWLVACADNHAAHLKTHAYSNTVLYGFSEAASWRGNLLGYEGGLAQLEVRYDGVLWGNLAVPMSGAHNLQNTLAAVAVAALLGGTPDAIRDGVRSFPGVRRRMEIFLHRGETVYIDDFAHHPTAIRETIKGARQRWPRHRIRVLFEPRSNTTVTKRFHAPMLEAFALANEVFLGPIHRGERIAVEERLDTAQLAAELTASGTGASAWSDVAALAEHVVATGSDRDVVLLMSNGAFGGIYGKLRALVENGDS